MKTMKTLAGAVMIAMMAIFGMVGTTPAIGATPNVVPQGRTDAGLLAQQALKSLFELLVQKMSADIDSTNRLAMALERANELKAAEMELKVAEMTTNMFIECHNAMESRNTSL